MAETALAAADQPPPYPTAKCKSCPAPIIWVLIGGDKVPVDAEPVALNGGGGTILLTFKGEGIAPVGRKVTNPRDLFGKRWVYRSHFETCPFAAHHRRTAFRPARGRTRS